MAELLVRVVSKTHADFYVDVKQTKRGDVIVVAEDGHVWGVEELSNPDWRIFKVPHVTVSAASAFLSPEPATSPDDYGPDGFARALQKRAIYLDLDATTLPETMKVYLADSTRTQATYTIPTSLKPSDIKLTREKRTPPDQIGSTSTVIG